MDKIISDIKNELVNQGLSESELARRAGFTQLKVNRLLNGITKRIDLAVIDKLRQTLGLSSSSSVPSTGQGVSCGERETLTRKQQILLELCSDEVLLDEAIKHVEKEKLFNKILKERVAKEACLSAILAICWIIF